MTKFSKLLTKYRERKGLQKKELADAVELSPGYISTMESGTRYAPPLEVCRKIADVLKLNKDELSELLQIASGERAQSEELEILQGSSQSREFKPYPISGNIVHFPLMGMVSAGASLPMAATDETFAVDASFLDKSLINNKNVFAVEMAGDCLIDRGIRDGDIVLVDKKAKTESGDIVLAQVDSDTTCKVIREIPGKPHSTFILEAANKNDPWSMTIDPKREYVKILGTVIRNFSKRKP